MNYTIQQIAEITNAKILGDEKLIINNISFDSRAIYSVENTAFIALKTEKNNGEKYIKSAIDKGVKIIISENKTENFENVSWIIVENTLTFLHQLSQYHITQFSGLQTIGITGSNGKTIVKEWLYQSISNDFETVKSPKSFNSQLGLPLSLLKTNEKHQIGIFEVGISKPTEMEKLEHIFSPKIGILTHIGTAHLSNFENEENLIDEKLKLFKNSEIIIFNGDNHLVFSKINNIYSSKRLISYGLGSHNDIHIASNWADRTTDVQISCFGTIFSLPVYTRDEATLSNALAVISVLKLLNFSENEIVEKINSLKAVEMRLESVNGIRNNLIINDSYNLDLDSLKIAFQFIQEYNKKEKVLVLTDFVEGKNSPSFYDEIAQLTNVQKFNKVFLIGEEISKHQHRFNFESFTFNDVNELIESHQISGIENSLILLKGARKFEIEKLKDLLELQKHDTVLEVNLNAILHNIKVHKSFLKPETKIMAMVKASSYGLGGYEIAEFLQYHHIDYLGVAYVDEGIKLRQNGITTPIIVMNPEQHSYDAIIEYNLEPEIYSFRVLNQFYTALQNRGYEQDYPIHIKLETGMHRLGFKYFEINELKENLKHKKVKIASIFSHLSSADSPTERDYTLEQIKIFEEVSTQLMSGLNYTPIRHILNSAGIVNFPEYQFDMVRIGIGMIGISSDSKIEKQLQNTVKFKTVISQISEVKKGDSIGYSRNYIAEKDTKIATIPVGYADGIPRLVGNKGGKVGIKGELVSIVGNVCMDMLMVDLGNIPANEGDEVVIFNQKPHLIDFSNYCKTIPYEVLTSISQRVKRIYIKD